MSEIIFIIESSDEGGYTAKALESFGTTSARRARMFASIFGLRAWPALV